MTYKQEVEKLQNKISRYQKTLLSVKARKAAEIEAVKAETQIKIERLTIPKSSLGRFLLDLILTVEKYR